MCASQMGLPGRETQMSVSFPAAEKPLGRLARGEVHRLYRPNLVTIEFAEQPKAGQPKQADMTTRFNMELSDDYKAFIAELMEKTNLRTQKDVFENALALYYWAVREVGRGRTIAAIDDAADMYVELQMPSLMAVRREAPPKPSVMTAKRPRRPKDRPTSVAA